MAPSYNSGYVLKGNVFVFDGGYYVPYTAMNKNTIIDTFNNDELCPLVTSIIQDGYVEYNYSDSGWVINSIDKNTIVDGSTTFTRLVPLQTSIILTRNASKDVIGHPNLIDNNTLYNITDDNTAVAYQAYTKSEVDSLIEAIYPVGSLYLTTNATCPLANLFGTWSKVGEKLLVDVPSQIAVKGNGKTLGITDRTKNYGLSTLTSTWGLVAGDTYNTSAGTSTPTTGYMTDVKSVGITTDATKSGMVADINSTSMAVNIFRRTA